MLLFGAIVTPLLFAVGMVPDRPRLGGAEQWPMPASLAITLSALWQTRELPRTRAFWIAVLGLGGLCTAAAVAAGHSLDAALWLAGANIVVALVCLRVYRPALTHETWEPRTPAALVTMLLACVAAAAVGATIGAYPGIVVGEPDLVVALS